MRGRDAVRDAGDPRRPGPRRRVRLGQRPDLPDLDVRAAGGRQAEGVGLRARRQPDARGVAAGARLARGRLEGPVLLERAGRDDDAAPDAEAGRPRADLGRRVRRDVPAARSRDGPVGPRVRHRRHDRPRRVPFGRTGGHGARVGRVPHQPVPQGGRHRRRGRTRAPRRRAVRRRQHVRDPVPAAAARARRRRRAALDDEVPRRTLGPDRRRARDERRRAGRTPLVPRERGGRRSGPDGLLPRPPRREDARFADGSTLPGREADRRVPPGSPEGHARPLPRAARPPGVRGRGSADAGLRRHGELRGRDTRRGDPSGGVHEAVLPRRVAGRRRVADRAPRPDDPRERHRIADRGPRHADPALGGDRAPGRSGRAISSRRSAERTDLPAPLNPRCRSSPRPCDAELGSNVRARKDRFVLTARR